jgi:D-glycero-alpha-D-manno-heptose-7-phosphate kinase
LIITRSPLRISLGGGGTDVPSYYKQFEGCLIAAAVNKYVYVTVTRPFLEGIYLKYSEIEHVERVNEIRHPIVREALKELDLKTPQIEITTLADIPSGTGLGSSGSFTTALLKALFSHYRRNLSIRELAELACDIEINRLREPVGKQDQYISAYGGINEFIFRKDGSVDVCQLHLNLDTVHDLEDNLLLFYTGESRSARLILKDQVLKSKSGDNAMIENLHFIKELGYRSKQALLDGQTHLFGELMQEHWEKKRARSPGISNELIDNAYQYATTNGAIGGKVVGAGGGGFLMFYANDREKLRWAMNKKGLSEVRFGFDFEGTKVIQT